MHLCRAVLDLKSKLEETLKPGQQQEIKEKQFIKLFSYISYTDQHNVALVVSRCCRHLVRVCLYVCQHGKMLSWRHLELRKLYHKGGFEYFGQCRWIDFVMAIETVQMEL